MWVCHFVSPVVGDIENAAETPKILDRGTLIVNEQTRYQKKRGNPAATPLPTIVAKGNRKGAYAVYGVEDRA
jgi:hypothetical protein